MICMSVSYNYFGTLLFLDLRKKKKHRSREMQELVGLIYLSTFLDQDYTVCFKGVMFTRMLV
jgi:hypothetical protein